MIDTIRLRIHGINDVKSDLQSELNRSNGFMDDFFLPHHNDLYIKMLKFEGKYHSRKVKQRERTGDVTDLNESDYLYSANSRKLTAHYQIRDVMTFTEESHVKRMYMNVDGSYGKPMFDFQKKRDTRIPSSYHGVTYNINHNKKCIDFEFSIPKYLYGHSLAQFVPQVDNRRFEENIYDIRKWSFQAKMLHKRLHEFIDVFLNDLCHFFGLEQAPSKKYIELRRIDLCFNQFFLNKETALNYLENLKVIKYKTAKDGQKAPDKHNTSMEFFTSTGSYFKIYHKGTEYVSSKHGDLKKHNIVNRSYVDSLSINKQDLSIYNTNKEIIWRVMDARGRREPIVLDPVLKEKIKNIVYNIDKRMPFQVNFFKKEMDKVLRYEVSLTGTWLSYNYKHKVFRNKCDLHNRAYKKYKAVKSIYDSRNTDIHQKKVSRLEKQNHDMFNKYLGSKVHLMLDGTNYMKRFETNGYLDYDDIMSRYDITNYEMKYLTIERDDVGIFSDSILKFAVKHFYNLVKKYQVKQVSNFDDKVTLLNNYNRLVKERVEAYNLENEFRIKKPDGTFIVQKGRRLKKASQLLTRKELVEKGFKTVNVLTLMTIINLMKEKESFRSIRIKMQLSASQFCRYKKDLEKFGIDEQTMMEPEPVDTDITFATYYNYAEERGFKEKMYVKRKHAYYG